MPPCRMPTRVGVVAPHARGAPKVLKAFLVVLMLMLACHVVFRCSKVVVERVSEMGRCTGRWAEKVIG